MPIPIFGANYFDSPTAGGVVESTTAALMAQQGEILRKTIEETSQKAEAQIKAPGIATLYTDALTRISSGDFSGFGELERGHAMAATNPFLAAMAKDASSVASRMAGEFMDTERAKLQIKAQEGMQASRESMADRRITAAESLTDKRIASAENLTDKRIAQQQRTQEDILYRQREDDYRAQKQQIDAAHAKAVEKYRTDTLNARRLVAMGETDVQMPEEPKHPGYPPPPTRGSNASGLPEGGDQIAFRTSPSTVPSVGPNPLPATGIPPAVEPPGAPPGAVTTATESRAPVKQEPKEIPIEIGGIKWTIYPEVGSSKMKSKQVTVPVPGGGSMTFSVPADKDGDAVAEFVKHGVALKGEDEFTRPAMKAMAEGKEIDFSRRKMVDKKERVIPYVDGKPLVTTPVVTTSGNKETTKQEPRDFPAEVIEHWNASRVAGERLKTMGALKGERTETTKAAPQRPKVDGVPDEVMDRISKSNKTPEEKVAEVKKYQEEQARKPKIDKAADQVLQNAGISPDKVKEVAGVKDWLQGVIDKVANKLTRSEGSPEGRKNLIQTHQDFIKEKTEQLKEAKTSKLTPSKAALMKAIAVEIAWRQSEIDRLSK